VLDLRFICPLSQEPEIHKDILVVTSDDQFNRELKQAGETVVVVDFKADW